MSRAHNARQKAIRQARSAGRSRPRQPRPPQRHYTFLVPISLIAAIFVVVGVLGFSAGGGASKEQIEQEVTALLEGIPQQGTVLGSPRAPVAVRVYADLDCPTVKLFVEKYLPSIIERWVRGGDLQLDYRSLQTDTFDEDVFFEQEIAALAAGRQDGMWNFFLTFARQQGEVRTDYVTDEFLTGIASQVPGLALAQWERDRTDPRLSRQVALGVYSGHRKGLRFTPSLLLGLSEGDAARGEGRTSIRRELEVSLGSAVRSLREEVDRDSPTLRAIDVEGG